MIKVSCAWGDGPDVLVSFEDKPFICYEDPKNDPPPRGQWVHGYVSKGSFDLTAEEARNFALELLNASKQVDDIEKSYEKYWGN